jgi:hypothetical protein
MAPMTLELEVLHLVALVTVLLGIPHERFPEWIPYRGFPIKSFRAHKGMQISAQIVRYCCPTLIKIRMLQQILVNLPNIKFNKNPFSGF